MDDTPPRNRLIALYSAIAVFTLLALKPAFDAYYDRMHSGAVAQGLEIGQDLAPLEQARGRWAAREQAVERAMDQLAERGRLGVPALAPTVDGEMNLDPLRGWQQLQREVQSPAQAAQAVERVEPEALEDTDLPVDGAAPPPAEVPIEPAVPDADEGQEAAAPARPTRPTRPAANPAPTNPAPANPAPANPAAEPARPARPARPAAEPAANPPRPRRPAPEAAPAPTPAE